MSARPVAPKESEKRSAYSGKVRSTRVSANRLRSGRV
jgi:hypothetical protein